jgi:lambda repressor-like predicted transcriptional regulator
VELFERIRIDRREEGSSIHELARRHHVHRRTVREALASAIPPPRRAVARAAPAIDPHRATIRSWLTRDLDAPRKQRHTARRVWQRLVDEEDAIVAESTVRRHVRAIRAELVASISLVTVPQVHPPGA